MRDLYETKYTSILTTSNEFLNTDNTAQSTRSILDADFDSDDEELDEIEHYISEKLANKEIKVLEWWKV
jgi:hypothetical protein